MVPFHPSGPELVQQLDLAGSWSVARYRENRVRRPAFLLAITVVCFSSPARTTIT